MLQGAFAHINMNITLQLNRIQRYYPNLFNQYLSCFEVEAEANVNADTVKDIKEAIAATAHYLNLDAWDQLKRAYLCRTKLSSKFLEVCHPGFHLLMPLAMDAYGLKASHWGKKSLYWYEYCSFISAVTFKWEIFHIGNYIKLTSGELALIQQIYTHAFKFKRVQWLFI